MCNFLLYYYNVSRVNKTEGRETQGAFEATKSLCISHRKPTQASVFVHPFIR